MDASRAAEQGRDLKRVSQLWRKLGHSPGTIRVYCDCVRRILRQAPGCNYQQLCADRVVRLSQSYAHQHHSSPQSTRRMWLSAFRALAWGLQRLGKAAGSIDLTKPTVAGREPVMLAFIEYG